LSGMHDLENELQEAMSETVVGEESLLDGEKEKKSYFLPLQYSMVAFSTFTIPPLLEAAACITEKNLLRLVFKGGRLLIVAVWYLLLVAKTKCSAQKGFPQRAMACWTSKGIDDLPFQGHPSAARRKTSNKRTMAGADDEEFFCLTPEDCRSLGSDGRSRNASAASQQSKKEPPHMTLPDAKMFSVAVENAANVGGSADGGMDVMRECAVDSSGTSGTFAVVSTKEGAANKTRAQPPTSLLAANREAMTAQALSPIMSESDKLSSSSVASSTKKKSKKSKKKIAGSKSATSASSGDDCQADVLIPSLATSTREVTPMCDENEDARAGQAIVSTPAVVKVSDEEFMPARRRPLGTTSTTSDEDEDDMRAIRNRRCGQSEDEELACSPEASEAKPSIPSWVNDSSSAIIKGIHSSSQLWEQDSEDDVMSRSTGFETAKKSTASARQMLPSVEDQSSEDDTEFKPALSRRQRKQKIKESQNEGEMRSRAGSFADSESSLALADQQPPADPKEGWSFEADELDVDRLIDEVVGGGGAREDVDEEKTALEDVFKFDSELALKAVKHDQDEDDDEEEGARKMTVSLDDLKDALDADEDDEEEEGSKRKMTSSLNVSFDEESLIPTAQARESLSNASSGCVGSTSESSVSSSPNPKKGGKGKKKKRKRF